MQKPKGERKTKNEKKLPFLPNVAQWQQQSFCDKNTT